MAEMKLCKDCKYIRKGEMCAHDADTDPVDGKKIYSSCYEMRDTVCGKEAKFYKKKLISITTTPMQVCKGCGTLQPKNRPCKQCREREKEKDLK
jgi:RNA polymerase subunit RPABC4/transcription elongation factor Spt4